MCTATATALLLLGGRNWLLTDSAAYYLRWLHAQMLLLLRLCLLLFILACICLQQHGQHVHAAKPYMYGAGVGLLLVWLLLLPAASSLLSLLLQSMTHPHTCPASSCPSHQLSFCMELRFLPLYKRSHIALHACQL
jgi:hypothetical protein